MTDLVRFQTNGKDSVLVEMDDNTPGLELIARDGENIGEAGRRLDQALGDAGPLVASLKAAMQKFAPDAYEVEFGIKLSVEAGVILAKTSGEAHFSVKLSWNGTSGAPSE